MLPPSTAIAQATSRVLNWRRPLPVSSACTSKEVTYSRSPTTTGVPHTSFDIRNRQGRQRPGPAGALSGACAGAGTGAVGAVTAPFTPTGGRTQPVAGPASAPAAEARTSWARGPGPIGTCTPDSRTGPPASDACAGRAAVGRPSAPPRQALSQSAAA